MSESYESFGVDDVDDLLDIADAKKNAALTRKSKRPSAEKAATAKKAATSKKPATKKAVGFKKATPKKAASKKPAAAKKVAGKKPAVQETKQAEISAGFLTRGLRGGVSAAEGAAHMGLWGWCALAASVVLAVLCQQAWRQAPHAWAPQSFLVECQDDLSLPNTVAKDLLKYFPRRAELGKPTPDLLLALREHLAAQPVVADVYSVDLGYDQEHTREPMQVVRAHLQIREPVLPVMLENKRRASVDLDGVVLPEALDAPADRPVIWGLDNDRQLALKEVLAFWPYLANAMDPAGISDIYLNEDLLRPNQRGIVIKMSNGVRVLWGAPGESRYGVDHEHKVRQIVHALACQGDASPDTVIDARFPEASYVSRL